MKSKFNYYKDFYLVSKNDGSTFSERFPSFYIDKITKYRAMESKTFATI